MGTVRLWTLIGALALAGALAFLIDPTSGTVGPMAPDFLLDVEASQDERVVTYVIHFDNVGTGNASVVILRDVLPEGTTYLPPADDEADVEDGVWTMRYNGLAPGTYSETIAVGLPDTVRDGDHIVNYVDIEYVVAPNWVTKAYWHEFAVEFAPVPLQPPVAQPFPLLLLSVPVAGGALAAGYVALRPRRGHRIEQVFLVHNSGMLIHHWAEGTSSARDIDILGGMLVVLKEFVRDSFREKAGGLTEFQFGDSRVVLVEGRHSVLAAVVLGDRVNGLSAQISAAIADFERRHETVLTDWSGQIDSLPEAKAVVDGLVHGEYHHRRAGA